MPITDALVTRFPNGISTVTDTDILNGFGQPDPTKYHVFFDDFDIRNLTDGTIAKWTDTLNAGTVAVAAANNGTIVLTAANTDEALTQTQATTATWLPSVSKKFWLKSRFKVSSGVLADLFVGLAVIDTTLIDGASGLGMTDAIGFWKAATDTSLTAIVRKDASTGATSLASLGSVASDTFMTVGMYYAGAGTMYTMVDGVVNGSFAVSSTYWPDAQLSPSLAVAQEGTGGANLLTVDYLFIAAER